MNTSDYLKILVDGFIDPVYEKDFVGYIEKKQRQLEEKGIDVNDFAEGLESAFRSFEYKYNYALNRAIETQQKLIDQAIKAGRMDVVENARKQIEGFKRIGIGIPGIEFGFRGHFGLRDLQRMHFSLINVHPKFIKHSIDHMFVVEYPRVKVMDPKEYRVIELRDTPHKPTSPFYNKRVNLGKGIEYNIEECEEQYKRMLESFLKRDQDNHEGLFIETELKKCRSYQRFFRKYNEPNNKEHKRYYFKLQRWITFLNDKKEDRLKIKASGDEKSIIESKEIRINNDVVDKLASLLSGYFHKERESDLHKLLRGAKISNKLIFEGQQNQLSELFLRLYYNGYISNTKKEVANWICNYFSYIKDGSESGFNFDTVYNVLTKRKGEVTKPKRLFEADWLPYKSR